VSRNGQLDNADGTPRPRVVSTPDGGATLEQVVGLIQAAIAGLSPGGGGGGVTDHGALSGLGDDDHPQYHNDTRGDARYAPLAQGVTNGDSHDHAGGDGAQIDHGGLAGLADDDHTRYVDVNGTRGLTADWDAGSYEIRAQTFESDVATGTAPIVVASTTAVENLHTPWTPSPAQAAIWEDWLAVDYHGSHYWTRDQSGTGAATGCTYSDATSLGVITAYTGSTAAGYATIRLYAAQLDPSLGGGVVTMIARCKTSHTVDGVNEFWCNIGWGDSAVGADETDGIYWRLVIGAAVVTPYICVAGGAARTQTPIIPPGGWAPTAYHEYKIVTAADGLSSEFFMDGVSYGTITSADANYPTSGQRCGMKFGVTKTVGTAQREIHCDYVGIKKVFTTARA